MSFMFNPSSYEDQSPVNSPELSDATVDSIVCGLPDVVSRLACEVGSRLKDRSSLVIGLDGYVGADWKQLVNLLSAELTKAKLSVATVDVASCYKSSQELDEMLAPNLPLDLEKDPVLLFGKLFEGGYETLFDQDRLEMLVQRLKTQPDGGEGKAVQMVYGAGSCFESLRPLCDLVVYLDVTPKQSVLRIKTGQYRNLGDGRARPFKETMRRCYFYDFELAMHLRANLIKTGGIDFYIASDNPNRPQLIPGEAFNEICSSLVNYPFRCKPVYLEGVWGGHYIKNLRHLPDTMDNCAWIFDLIPLEVSLLVRAGSRIVEIPYFAFVNREGVNLMGQECVDTFGGYFPIRFNYDDTYHSSGNMSIQVHSGHDYNVENFGEHGRQDESYYVVATGHGAKTYIGFNDDADPDEFIREAKKSEKESTPVDYKKYVNHVESLPGTQLMLPAGTIHSSGRNQVVLEIGSLTVGSYTYKMYDYLRADLDGNPRPIHMWHGENVLRKDCTASWVKENLVPEPRLMRSGDGWAEYMVGEHDLLYFNLHRLEFEKEIEGDTNGVFHVLTLVDGEKIAVYPKDHPERRYEQNYLDMVVVPANVGPYVVENLGNHPVCVHKTCLKNNFTKFV